MRENRERTRHVALPTAGTVADRSQTGDLHGAGSPGEGRLVDRNAPTFGGSDLPPRQCYVLL